VAQPCYLSFFSGCLGLDLGFHAAGFQCLSLNEFNWHSQAWSLKPMKGSIDNWYHRSAWDQPAHTLTCDIEQMPKAPHCHPDELRGLSVEECAAIQTFPPGFCFVGSRNQRYKQIGNAVAPAFAQVVAKHLANHMASNRSK
jgi:site-specific DNA-cytosine methylase